MAGGFAFVPGHETIPPGKRAAIGPRAGNGEAVIGPATE